MKKTNNTVRIIGGIFRGKKLTFPDADGLRPTPDRIRETLFNWLMHDIRGAHCLDLFSGSGALGFEAFSRGAAKVVMVEKNPSIYAALQQTATGFQTDKITILPFSAEQYLAKPTTESFDIVFIDPPFAQKELYDCIHHFENSALLKPEGILYVESSTAISFNPTIWQNLKSKKAGQVWYGLYKKKSADSY